MKLWHKTCISVLSSILAHLMIQRNSERITVEKIVQRRTYVK